VAADTIDQLITFQDVERDTWTDALRPVQAALLPALHAIFQDRTQPEPRRLSTARALGDYLRKGRRRVAELLLDADEELFAVLFESLRTHGEQALPTLQAARRLGGLGASRSAARTLRAGA